MADRQTITGAPDDPPGWVTVTCTEQHGERTVRLQFRWRTEDQGSNEFLGAYSAQQKSMDHLMGLPIASIEGEMPWVLIPLPKASELSTEQTNLILGLNADGTMAKNAVP